MYTNGIVKTSSDDVKMEAIGRLDVSIDTIHDRDKFFNRCCFTMGFGKHTIWYQVLIVGLKAGDLSYDK